MTFLTCWSSLPGHQACSSTALPCWPSRPASPAPLLRHAGPASLAPQRETRKIPKNINYLHDNLNLSEKLKTIMDIEEEPFQTLEKTILKYT